LANAQALIGKTLGGCTLQEMIGKGKLSAVFLAAQTGLKPAVALKILLPVASRSPVERDAFLERFRQKMDILAAMQHPNILPIYEHGEYDGFACLVMPYMSDGTLGNVMEQEGQLPLSNIADYLDQLAPALDYAHEQSIFHRDITPTNILCTPDGQLLLTDFGLTDIVLERRVSQLRLLKANLFVGSPTYMAPEQVMGDSTDGSADIYAMGVILFQMVTGRLPFQGETPLAIAAQQVQDTPPSPSSLRPDLPVAAEQVILRSLAKKPTERYTHMQDVAHAFRVALTATETLPPAIIAETIAPEISSTSFSDAPVGQETSNALAVVNINNGSKIQSSHTSKATRVLPAAAVTLFPVSQSAPVTVDNGNIDRTMPTGTLTTVNADRQTPLPAARPRLGRAASLLRPMEPTTLEPQKSLVEDPSSDQPVEIGERLAAIEEVGAGKTQSAIAEQERANTTPTVPDTDTPLSMASNTDIVSPSLPLTITGSRVLDIPNTEQTTEGTLKLTGAVKIVQVPVAGQPGRYVTGLLPVLPETDQPEEPSASAATDEQARSKSLEGRAKYLFQRVTTLPKQRKIAVLSLLVVVILLASGLVAIVRPHNNTDDTKNVHIKQNVPNVQATLASQATATVQANNILSDTLSQNIHNWPIARTGSQQFFFADGAYHILDEDSKQSAPSLLPGIVLQEPLNYRLSMEEIKGNDSSINNSFGMILFFSSQSKAGHTESTFYSFEVVNIKGGQYQFWKYDSSKGTSPWTSLWHQTFGNEFHQGEGSKNMNTFDVSVRNGVFTFTINGKVVGSVKDSSFSSGQVGMLVNLNGTEVAFSNLSLTYQ
jgi:serine/threonine protein kinase